MLRQFLKRPAPIPPPAPEEPLAVIGDIHGCAVQLGRALDWLDGQAYRIICVGDYIDRGPESGAVLATLFARRDIVCLMGNHEDMMLRFLDMPDDATARWLKHGGDATLESVGLAPPLPEEILTARDALAEVLGTEIIEWVRALPDRYVSGNVAVVHAGADPALPLPDQTARTLVWGHPKSGRPRTDGQWIVHGHTIVPQASASAGYIRLDTGAYATGKLTVALIDNDRTHFETFTDS